jgi:hypothetical protein
MIVSVTFFGNFILLIYDKTLRKLRTAVLIAEAEFCQPDQLWCNGLLHIDFKNSSENLTLSQLQIYILLILYEYEKELPNEQMCHCNSDWHFVGTIFSKALY